MSHANTETNSTYPYVTAVVTFLSAEEGGRSTPLVLSPLYRPHIVVQSPDVRKAKVDDEGVGCEHYLGVRFIDNGQAVVPGEAMLVSLELMYHPRTDYSEVVPNATFTIREGGRVVGYGRVTERHLE